MLNFALSLAAATALAIAAPAQVLTNESFVISSGAGQSGAGTQTSCMIMSDGTSWSGGAVGVQGTNNLNCVGSHYAAANVTFKYNVGPGVDSLNSTYGAGKWTISNPKLTFQYTLYANNNRFNAGAGTFEIYWVGNDNWVQGSINPAYATNAATLTTWATNDALLASEYYNWTTPGYIGKNSDLNAGVWVTDKNGIRQATNSYSLGLNSAFVNDITSATVNSNPNVSLYLMATSDSVGLTIFTGGANFLPTLSFDVIGTPPTIATQRNSDGSMTMEFAGVPGCTYCLEATTDLANPVWDVISTNVAGTDGLCGYTDTNATNYSQRFYRIHNP